MTVSYTIGLITHYFMKQMTYNADWTMCDQSSVSEIDEEMQYCTHARHSHPYLRQYPTVTLNKPLERKSLCGMLASRTDLHTTSRDLQETTISQDCRDDKYDYVSAKRIKLQYNMAFSNIFSAEIQYCND